MPKLKYKSIMRMDRLDYWWVDNEYWSKEIPKTFNSCQSHRNFRTFNRAVRAFNALDSDVRLIIAYQKKGKFYIKWEVVK